MLAKARIAGLAFAAALAAAAPALGVCGDAVLDEGEQCDDGNTLPYDGCSQTCRLRYCKTPAPTDCVMAKHGKIRIQERGEGDRTRASWKIDIADFGEATAPADFGDPVFGVTRYDICVYGDRDEPHANLVVARGFDQCGPKQKSCWRLLGDEGYRYTDPDWSASGVRTIDLVASATGGGRIRISAKRGQEKIALPPLTKRLEKNQTARVYVLSTDGRCFGTEFPYVQANDVDDFRATNPR
jgi:cysteine-rich repeat protein